ncbi:DegT/DnrJ/EryC1/StrS family aminotransferase, partial [Candidatus Pelagibacter sp.]|nr:DegT/DnrJ/EryC1/StrS family aminotransferase [Candidatus Pelagibacter sp.]
MSKNYQDDLKKLLCKNHKKKYCLLTGNATTALYLSLKSLPNKIKKIGIINNSCIHIPISIILAKKKIIYIDINLKNFSVDINDLKKKKIDALIAVHSFGYACDIEKIKNYTKKKNIFLIEDLAVAQGLICKNKNPAGYFGDISILSFGSGKVINAGGGGALLTDNFDTYKKLLNFHKNLENLTDSKKLKVDKMSKLHTKVYNQLFILKKRKNLLNSFNASINKNAKNLI